MFSVIVKLERAWPRFLLEANPNTSLGWGESRSERHYLMKGTGKQEENGATDFCTLLGRASLA